jgi:hypothetical protein
MEPIPPQPRRNWTVPIIVVAIGLVVVLIICLAGTAAAIFAWRANDAAPAPSPSAAQASVSPTPAASPVPVHPADCLIGDWLETSYSGYADLYGTRVQLSGKGAVIRYTPAEALYLLENIVITGTANGKTYEVIHNGTLKVNYTADDTTIRYSNPQATGTTTWKINGSVEDTEPLKAALKPDTYRCQGNELRLFGEQSATELRRLGPAGTPI